MIPSSFVMVMRVACIVLLCFALRAAAQPASPDRGPWANYVETDFPFYSSVVDARALAKQGWPTNNLTPRALVLKPAPGIWAAFDTELLRVAVVWKGQGLSPVGMAPGSYHEAGRKAPPGQDELPAPIGEPLLATGLYPGWQIGTQPILSDPRERNPDPRELARGPLAPTLGKFNKIQLTERGAELHYTVSGREVVETITARETNNHVVLQRSFTIGPGDRYLWLIPGENSSGPLHLALSDDTSAKILGRRDGPQFVQVRSSAAPIKFQVAISTTTNMATWKPATPPAQAARWPGVLKTTARHTATTNGFAIEHIDLPLDNPWRRNIRLGDITFLPDASAALVTFDGDVWLAQGLHENQVTWRRFASGLHEPMGIATRDGDIFVHDRNGIWRLKDTDKNGEADAYELFSNAFHQTAETREFAAGLRVAPDGSFVIGKGGIQATARGRHNGTVLRISPDGSTVTVLGHGFREPFIGVHPRTGLVTASDQQGNHIPATPLQIVRDGQFYGYLTGLEHKGHVPPPITEPLTWIPHPINASGVGQVWLTDARMAGLNEALVHIGYYRPELFLVRLNERGSEPEAAVVSLTRDLEFAPLHGAVNPADGFLYVTGFQIWGSDALRISGLARIRPASERTPLPREIIPLQEGILLRFDLALDSTAATDPRNFSAERWEYRRTAAYGSPHFKMDGSRGQENLVASSAYLSRDGRSVFIGIPEMRPVMQMRLGWTLSSRDGQSFAHNTYFTPKHLPNFDPAREGFGAITVDLAPRALEGAADVEISAQEGARLAELMGCVACHSTDGSTLGKVGPSFKGLFGNRRQFADGKTATADEAYFRESIKEPAARIVRGFDKSDTGMPSYDGVLNDAQIESLILYLKTVK